jgi:hypothetical protein
VLLLGAILAPGRRTVAVVLCIMGLSHECQFQAYPRVLNRVAWSSWELSRTLLKPLVQTFVQTGLISRALDPALEHRRGAKTKARSMCGNPVRSNKPHFAKASGSRRLSLMPTLGGLLHHIGGASQLYGFAV